MKRQSKSSRVALILTLGVCPTLVCADDAEELEFFEKRIRPVLIEHCYECHSSVATEVKGGFRLDSRDGIRRGGETGPAVVPENVPESLLIDALRHESFEMPPGKDRLPDAVIADFTTWIEAGAVDPRDNPPMADEVARMSWQSVLENRRIWWSLQSVSEVEIPPAQHDESSDHPVDRFVEARLYANGLQLSQRTEPLVLLRRLSLILTGLPPTPGEIEAFQQRLLRDPNFALRAEIERVLESPHYGERWARHWMDIVRFAEQHGYEWNHEIRDAWRYRDYLIRAFNQDLAFDQLVREHIAGDLLDPPRMNHDLQINESVIGTAFWRFGELGHDDCVKFPEIRFDAIDNQIDTLTKAFQATTVSCARCHDHKFDAVSTRDYYALMGILESSRNVNQTIDSNQRFAGFKERLSSLKQTIRSELSRQWLVDIDEVDDKILSAMNAKLSGEKTETSLAKTLELQDVKIEHPGFVLQRILALEPESEIQTAWNAIAKKYRQEQTERAAFNSTHFESWLHLGNDQPADWRSAGLGLTKQLVPAGEFVVSMEGDAVVKRLLPKGVYSHLLSSRLNGTLQSPWMPGDRKHISVKYFGGGLSMLRPVVDSCTLNEFAGGGLAYLSDDTIRWKTFKTREDESHRAFIELATKSDNVRWPDRPGRASGDKALLESASSWFGVVDAVVHDCNEPPRPELTYMLSVFNQTPPASHADVASLFQNVCRDAVIAWRDGRATNDDVVWINWMLDAELLQKVSRTSSLTEAVAKYREAEAAMPEPQVVAGMADHGQGFESPVLVRGNPLDWGPLEARRYLEVLDPSLAPLQTNGSGRRELAELIASDQNPLTARVIVNRVWHHVFGFGLVRTVDDFGQLGDTPSHPELLDYLAQKFVDDGWSVKKLLRLLVTSQTFQQASVATSLARERDPENRLLHHFSVRRLDAESIRDSLLLISGRLDRKMFGVSVEPFRTEEKSHRKLFVGPLDGDGRRSLYLKVTRMEGPRFLALFDLPDQTATRGRRDRSNVPAQALALLNDPFVIDQARVWGESLIARENENIEQRVDFVLLQALGRLPTSIERSRMIEFVHRLVEVYEAKSRDALSNQSVWQDVAHAVFNMKELVYIR